MLAKDVSQQAAELRQAFLRHLPRRVDLLQKKGFRLVRGAWDVNAAALLLREVQLLAGASGKHGLVDASDRLYQLELRLTGFMENLSVPDDDQRQLLETLVGQLQVEGAQAQSEVHSVKDLLVTAVNPGHRPILITPPDDYWRRFSVREVDGMDTSNTPTAAAVRLKTLNEPPKSAVLQSEDGNPILVMGDPHPPEIEPIIAGVPQSEVAATQLSPAESEVDEAEIEAHPAMLKGRREQQEKPRRVFYLADISPFARELITELLRLGFSVERMESPEELKEMLGSLAPDLIVIDSVFFDDIDHLGEFIRRVRSRVQEPLPLILFSSKSELTDRLKAMRAGAASLLSAELSPTDAGQRIREVLSPLPEQPYRVLIVEDDRSQALFAESVLKKAGMATCAVTDALETIDKLVEFKPDLILMDLYMPKITGMELTAIIRERSDFISTPIVFLSGEQDSEKQFEALDAGGDDFLSKPIRPKHLMSAVVNRARRARALAERTTALPKEHETGLYERAHLLDRLSEALVIDDLQKARGALLFIELDRARELRDSLGMLGYEALTKQIGATVASFAGASDLCSQGSDSSFLFLAQDRPEVEIGTLASALLSAVAAGDYASGDEQPAISISIGGCLFKHGFADAGAILSAAEKSCAQAHEGDQTGQFALHQPKVRSSEDSVADAIAEALENDQFELLYQPIVSLQGVGEEQYEALLRLRSDDGSSTGAAEIMAAAEPAGLAFDVDRWVLKRALMTIDERSQRGKPVRLFVAQSGWSLADETRAEWLQQMLATRRVAADKLVMEFRLAEALPRLNEAMGFFQSIRALGVGLVLDEFEPDMTALQMLSYLAVDSIKLHERYSAPQLDEATGNELRSLIKAAHAADKKVMASKVENAQSAAALWTLGVDYIQGNFVQQPGDDLRFDFSASAL